MNEAPPVQNTPSHHALPAVLALLLVAGSPLARAQAADDLSLENQLRTVYKLSVVSGDGTLASQGSVLRLVHGGLTAAPYRGSVPVCAQNFHAGQLEAAGRLCQFRQTSVLAGSVPTGTPAPTIPMLPDGAPVEVTRIQVDRKKDTIRLDLVDALQDPSGAPAPSQLKAAINFIFPKAYLTSADAGQISQIIEGELQLGNGGGAPQAAGAAGGGGAFGGPPAGGGGQAQPTATVHLGMTREQVLAALGQPAKMVDLGAKMIFVYPDLKITFQNNQVSDVQ